MGACMYFSRVCTHLATSFRPSPNNTENTQHQRIKALCDRHWMTPSSQSHILSSLLLCTIRLKSTQRNPGESSQTSHPSQGHRGYAQKETGAAVSPSPSPAQAGRLASVSGHWNCPTGARIQSLSRAFFTHRFLVNYWDNLFYDSQMHLFKHGKASLESIGQGAVWNTAVMQHVWMPAAVKRADFYLIRQ